MSNSSRAALICACLLSVGSHWSVWQLGALRPTLGSSADFASAVSAIEIANTLTPLVAGALIPRFGAGRSAIVATAANAIGQAIALVGRLNGSFALLLAGLFISGTSAAPLSVIQESVIVTMAPEGRNMVLALGLLAGKATAFFASIAALPINDAFGSAAPFLVSVALGVVSLVAALTYARMAGDVAQASGGVDHTRLIPLSELVRLGDAVTCYYLVCALSGALWFPTVHLAPDMLRTLFEISPQWAATIGSVVLVTPLFLYVALGRVLDKSDGRAVFRLFVATSIATFVTYPLLLVRSLGPLVSLLPFAIGYGASPLLLVASVPHIVSTRYVSSVLGMHKATEMSGAIIYQTIAGRTTKGASDRSTVTGVQSVVTTLLALNVAHIALLLVYGRLAHTEAAQGAYDVLPADEVELEDVKSPVRPQGTDKGLARRGVATLALCGALIAAAWVACVVGRL